MAAARPYTGRVVFAVGIGSKVAFGNALIILLRALFNFNTRVDNGPSVVKILLQFVDHPLRDFDDEFIVGDAVF